MMLNVQLFAAAFSKYIYLNSLNKACQEYINLTGLKYGRKLGLGYNEQNTEKTFANSIYEWFDMFIPLTSQHRLIDTLQCFQFKLSVSLSIYVIIY